MGGDEIPGLLQLYVVLHLLLGAPLNTLVNKEHRVPLWYAPGNHTDARTALDFLIKEINLPVEVMSDYRSYSSQAEAFVRLMSDEGEERADEVIARPGHSEHQLGTVFDVAWAGLPIEYNDSRNRKLWSALEARAHEFGFVISFPLKAIREWPYNNRWSAVVTEYRWEPWHLRYVGLPLAKEIFDAGYLDPQSAVLPQDFYQPWPDF